MKPPTPQNITARHPSRLASQPVIGVATAVATKLSVMTQAISSCVADSAPRNCGSTTLASVMVMPNSRLDSCTVNKISHCRGLMLNKLTFDLAVIISEAECGTLPTAGNREFKA